MDVVEETQRMLAALDAAADLGAVVARDDDAALAEAARLDRLEPSERAPLHGRPVTVKDWIDVAGLPCEGEARERTGHVPATDATVVARLRAAGAVVVGKTQPGPHHPVHGRCRHPLDPDRTPGGSSSGEAALLGAGVTTLGIGSDSGGSIRLPAAWCGVAGLKPSFGLVPDTGHRPRVGPHEDGRTVIGPLAARVEDLEVALRVIAGPDGVDGGCVPVPVGDPSTVSSRGLRVAVVEGEGMWRPQATTAAAVGRAVNVLRDRGATIVGEAIGPHLDECLEITQRYWRRDKLSGAEADRQLRDWDKFTRRLTIASGSFDVVVGPVVLDVAPLDRPLSGEDYVFTLPWSLTGWPAVSVPAGSDANGLPLAVQVAAPRWHDHVALAVAGWLEADLAS